MSTRIKLKSEPIARVLVLPLTNGGCIEYHTGIQCLIVTEDNVRFTTLASSKDEIKRIATCLLEVISNG